MSVNFNVAGAMAKKRSGGFDVDLKELFLRPSAPKNDGEKATYTIRFLENPTPVLVYWAKKRDPKTKKNYDCPFPDAEFSKRPSRIGYAKVTATGDIQEDPNCPWYRAGYTRQLRYYINVLNRNENKVQIFDCPATVLEKVVEQMEVRKGKKRPCPEDPSSWTEKSVDFDVTVTRTSAQGGVDYSVTADWESMAKLGDEELDVIRALPINKEAKSLSELKLWPLDTWTKPSPVKAANDEVAADDSAEDLSRANKAASIADGAFSGGETVEADEMDLGDLGKDYL